MPDLTIFYDGTCPLCAKEMTALKKHDSRGSIKTVDIYSDEFAQYPQINANAANTVLHAIDQAGQLILGLDVTYKAWDLVGKGWVYAPLRWPLVRPVADWCYLRFANNRYRVSYWLTGVSRCDSNRCSK
ncbi:thiol-disulfide oxidoreductase DCC family protein [uncultured Vibrio sp.]|uniref:thiol-disulfide oxidoreductase DCC family protein n=1 Tax=uncultured Vibrio sp. TaxID=114054 RepID=UPI0025E4634D|nr:DCC1-like thiol-disulfide oxidoreductase family protein [uncultured Vibrio sp.]